MNNAEPERAPVDPVRASDAASAESSHDPPGDSPNAFRWYGVGVGSWFGAWGMQQVLFSWILVGELKASSEWVGIAQTSTMLPALLLLMAGGAVADRVDPRRLLIALHVAAAMPVIALGLASASGALTMPAIVAYGLTIGTLQAFVMPSRDTLLSRVAGRDMMHAVTTMTAIQFGCQALGTVTAGAARWVGSATMLFVQAAVLLIGAVATRGVPAVPPRTRAAHEAAGLSEIWSGLAYVLRTPNLRSPAAMVVAVGIFFIGPFVVVFPLLVRDYYGSGVDSLAVILMLFPLGTILGSLVLRRRGIRRKGQATILALVFGASAQMVIGFGVPFVAMMGLTLLWGLGASVFITCSRTLFQEAAPDRERGRVLAIYQLGFMGGAPIGSLLSGFSSSLIGLHGTLIMASLCMLTLAAVMAAFTTTRQMT
jgi:MFS family permease